MLLGSRAVWCRRWSRQRVGPGGDAAALSFLLAQTLAAQQEEVEAKERAAVAELEAAAKDRLPRELDKDRAEAVRVSTQSWPTLSRVEQLAIVWFLAKDKVRKRKVKRKKKKRRMKKTSESSSSCGHARRRQRQWHALYTGFPGDVPLRAVSFGFWQARDVRHHGRYGPEGLLEVRRHPFRATEADPHGPDYSADHRVSPVAVRFRLSMLLLWWSCLPCCARVDSGSLCPRLVMLVSMRLGCVPLGCCSQGLRHLGRYDHMDSCSGMYKAGIAGDNAPRAGSFLWFAGP